MAPIRKGDGTAIAPKGITEARKGDGTVLWSPDSGIPDSAIHQWKFSEGTGSTAADSIGGSDGSINGATWASGTYTGEHALDGDGTDDYIRTTSWGDFGSGLGSGSAVAFTIETTDAVGHPLAVTSTGSSGDINFAVKMGNSYGNFPYGRVGLAVRDSSNKQDQGYSNTAVNDGNKHRVVVNNPDSSASNMEFWIDGVEDGTNVERSQGASSFGNFTHDVSIFADNNSGSLRNHLNGTLDNVIVFDDVLSSREIQDDYDRQPWS